MLSLVMPIYNQARFIRKNVPKVYNFLKDNDIGFERILAEDGSTDKSKEIARKMERQFSGVRLLSYDKRMGKADALKNAFQKAEGDIVGFIDTDLAPDYRAIPVMLGFFPKYDIVIGSRYVKGSSTKRNVSRKLYSVMFNTLCLALLGSRVKDHQCGFKLFKRSKIMLVLDKVKDSTFFWDAEVLARSNWQGLKIKEIGIKWKEGDETTLDIMKDSTKMFLGAFRLFLERFL